MLQHESTDIQFRNIQNTANCSQVHTHVEKSLKRSGKAAHQVHVHGYVWEGEEGKQSWGGTSPTLCPNETKNYMKALPALRGTGNWVEILAKPLVRRGDWWVQDTLVLSSS